jgi:phospholipid/cholesterol/gamma-HCH transport system permease protein
MIGGLVVARQLLGIQPAAYWVEMFANVNLTDIATGLIKAVAFGLIVGMAGCLRGLQAERSAEGVGRAATSAVVTALLLLVVADALFAVVFHILRW